MSPSVASSTATSHHHGNHHGNHHHGNHDVRRYVTIRPIPAWEGSEDSKLLARSSKHYTLDFPSREQVFRDNYARRKQQMDTQGYQSVPWKPYKEVGFPIYLSTKQLVQTSLGQTDFENEKGNTGSSEDGIDPEADSQVKKSRKSKLKNKKMSAATFVMKHKEQSELQSIERDRRSVQEAMEGVKKGHALFPMLEEERNRSDSAFLLDKQDQLRRAHHEVRIHPVATEESTDKDFVKIKQRNHHRMSLKTQGSRASLMSSGSHASSRMVAKKAEVEGSAGSRPFTPVHSNICDKIKDEGAGVCTRVWKQLCALHWIYVASTLNLDRENKKRVSPLSECWRESDPGGRVLEGRGLEGRGLEGRQEARTNENWRRFKEGSKKLPRSRSHRKGFHTGAMKRNSSYASNLSGYHGYQGSNSLMRNSSIASNLSGYEGSRSNRPSSARSGISRLHRGSLDSGNPLDEGVPPRPSSPGQSSVATTTAGGKSLAGSEFGDDDIEASSDHDDHKLLQKPQNHKALQKLLSTVATSVRNEMQSREKAAGRIAQQNNILPLSVFDWSRSNYCRVGTKEVSISKNMAPDATDVTDFEGPTATTVKLRPHSAAVHNRRNSTFQPSRPSTAATLGSKVKRPQSSPAKLSSFQFRFPSEDKAKNLGRIREDFEGVNDTKALQLHNLLSALEKRRKQRMEKKFETFRVSSSIHRDLRGMRSKAVSEMEREQSSRKKRAGVLPCDWLNTLNSNLPPSIHDDPNCDVILQKLGNLVITTPHPLTPDSFLGALAPLKPWELCCPDVSAAVEFVREKVVGMPTQQFDEWRNEAMTQRKVLIGADSSTIQQKSAAKV